MSPSVKEFDLSGLESVSMTDMELENALTAYLPEAESRAALLADLRRTLTQLMRGDCAIHCKDFYFEELDAWKPRLEAEGVYILLSGLASGAKALMVWDTVLALEMIDRLLGGEATEMPVRRPLTEIEVGVMSYLITKLLECFHQYLPQEAMPIRLEAVVARREDLAPLYAGVDEIALADFTVVLPHVSGGVQLVLPDSFIFEVMRPQVDLYAEQERQALIDSRLHQVGDLSYPMMASVGETELLPSEIVGLASGDIVLIDVPHVQCQEGQVTGELVLRPLREGAPTIVTDIRENGPPARLEVKKVYHAV